jgi:ABC-2 type transport system ATP-binding protein
MGMQMRLGFSIAAFLEPDILLVDEVLSVGDMAFQEKCTEKFADLRREGRTVVVVSHAVEQMRTFCDEAAWLQKGQLMGLGPASEVINDYADQAHNVHERSHDGSADAEAAAEQTKGRYGTGEVTIDKVEMLDAGGDDIRQVRTGDPVTLRMHFTCHELVGSPVFGFSIEHDSGFLVWGHNTMQFDWEQPLLHEGAGSIDVVIPSIPLRPGIFRVTAGINADRNSRTLDILPRVITFSVATGTPFESVGVTVMHSRFANLVQA